MTERPVTEVRVVPAEALVVGPDEVLIVRITDDGLTDEIVSGLHQALVDVGLEHRSLIITGRDLELAKANRTADGRIELPWLEEPVS